MVKRFVSLLFFLGLFSLAVVLVAPGFVNWNSHKDVILAQLQPHFSRKIDVKGNVGFRILPNPRILLENVSIENALSLERVEAKILFKPLLEGRVEVESINLVKPEVTLEIMPDGKPSWSGIFVTQKTRKLSQAANAISLEQLTVSDATLHYINAATGMEWTAKSLNLKISADTLLGPYRVSGDMSYNGSIVSIDIGTGRYEGKAAPVPVHVTLTPVEGLPKIAFNGVANLAQGLDLQGELSVSDGRLSSFLTEAFFQDMVFMNEIVDLSATMEMKDRALSLSDLKAKFGASGAATGSLVVQLTQGSKPSVKADLFMSNMTVDERSGFTDVPQFFTGRFDIKGKNIRWHGMNFPGLTLGLDIDDAVWVIRTADITASGNARIGVAGTVSPEKLSAALSLQATTADLEKTMLALGLIGKPLSKIFPSALMLGAKMEMVPERIVFRDVTARLDDKISASGVGEIRFSQSEAPDIAAKLKLEEKEIAWHALEGKNIQVDLDMSCKGMEARACAGTGNFIADALTVPGFTPSVVSKAMAALKNKPDDVAMLINEALRAKDKTVYKNVTADIHFGEGQAAIEHVKLSDEFGTTDVSATLDNEQKKYELSADISLKKPEGVPAIHLKREGDLGAASDYVLDVEAFEPWLEKRFPPPPPPPPQPEPQPEPEPELENKNANPIGGILERLDEGMEETRPEQREPDFIGPPAPGTIEEEILPPEDNATVIGPVPAPDNTPAQTP